MPYGKVLATTTHLSTAIHNRIVKRVRIEADDRAAQKRVLQYIVRCPLSIERVSRLSDGDRAVYQAEHHDPRGYPLPPGGRPTGRCGLSLAQAAIEHRKGEERLVSAKSGNLSIRLPESFVFVKEAISNSR